MLLLLGAVMMATVFLHLMITGLPFRLDLTIDDAVIHMDVPRRVIVRGQCVSATWDLEGIRAVLFYHNLKTPQGVTGHEEYTFCPENSIQYRFVVELVDGEVLSYEIPFVVYPPLALVSYGLMVFGMAVGAAYLAGWLPVPDLNRLAFVQRLPQQQKAYHLFAVGTIVVLTLLLFYPSLHLTHAADTGPHVLYAYQVATENKPISSPHFLYQILVIVGSLLVPGNDIASYHEAARWVYVVFNGAAALIAFGLIRSIAGVPHSYPRALLYAMLAVSTTVFTGINLLTLPRYNLYFGYFMSSSIYHNPTIIVLKPLALGLFWLTAHNFKARTSQSLIMGAGLFALTLAGLLAKPSYMIAFLPVVGLWWLWQLIRERRWNWAIVLGVLIPAVVTLFVQFVLFFTIVGETVEDKVTPTSRVVFDPFTAMLYREGNYWMMAYKLLASLAFPLVILLTHWRFMRRKYPVMLLLSGVSMLIALFYGYFVAESDWKMAHGNFLWSAESIQQILFVLAVAVLLANGSRVRQGWTRLAVGLLALHIASGMMWYSVNIVPGYAFFWW
jgi:hypothetical protein